MGRVLFPTPASKVITNEESDTMHNSLTFGVANIVESDDSSSVTVSPIHSNASSAVSENRSESYNYNSNLYKKCRILACF